MSAIIIALVAIGGLGWILYALGYDLINTLFDGRAIATFAYLILGAADIYLASRFYRGYRKHRGLTLPFMLMLLVIVSGIGWLLQAFRYNPVIYLFGTVALASIIYLILGLASIYWIVLLSGPGTKSKIYW